MTISSRTPEGTPNHCPVCISEICLEPSLPSGDAPCPKCGTLLWFIVRADGVRFYPEEVATPTREQLLDFFNGRMDQSLVRDLHSDSLDMVELVMELEEEFHLEISDQDAERIQTVDDLVEYMLRKGL